MKRSTSGFTIVELIIVIVVIGILATITLVAYNGAQQRAYNAQIISGVSSYQKLIETYYTFHGKYPANSKELANHYIAMSCLGTGYPDNFCGKVTGNDTYEDATFNAAVASVGTGGAIAKSLLAPGDETFVGAVYGIDMTDPEWTKNKSDTFARTIQYALKGADQNCQIPGSYAYRFDNVTNVTACEIILESRADRDAFNH